ncbi:MAG: hypothetical protein KDC57_09040 [Saprospiraceae bacterium]|nr:hypothetical protein [Saprospiraceae bacterium]
MKRIVVILFGLLPFALLAHPGHGIGNGWSFTHYSGSFEHSWILVLVVLAIAIGLARSGKKAS